MLGEFEKWLLTYSNTKRKSGLSKSSAYKYSRAIKTISEDMLDCGVINDSFLNIKDVVELSRYINKIKNSDDFILKNDRGNKMYSNALDYYLEFIRGL